MTEQTYPYEVSPGHWVILVDGFPHHVFGATSAAHAEALRLEALSPPPTAADVIKERARRLALGFDYDFGDERGVHRIGTTDADMAGWDEVTKGAQAAINLGGGATTIIGIVTDTGPVDVTALEFQQILVAATAHRQPIWHASFALQAMTPIPADYTSDSHWPA
jgi:hypothetical protein